MDNKNIDIENDVDVSANIREEIEAELEKLKLIDQEDKLYKLGEAAKLLNKKVPTLRLYVDEFEYYLKDELIKLESNHRMLTSKGIRMLDRIFQEKENGSTNEQIKQLIKETDGVPLAPTATDAFATVYKNIVKMFEAELKTGLRDYSSALLEVANKEQNEKYDTLVENLNVLMEQNTKLIEQNNELQEMIKEKENKGFLKGLFKK